MRYKTEKSTLNNHAPKILLNISHKKVFKFLLWVIIGFALINLFVNVTRSFFPDYPFRDMFIDNFSVDSERSFPTLYSVYSLQICSLLLGIIAYITKLNKGQFVRHWQALSLIFLYLSFDEALSFHERATEPLRNLLGTTGFLNFAWVIPASFLLIIFVLSYLKFLIALPKKTRNLFILSGGIFVTGALVMEMVAGQVLSVFSPGLEYILTVALEEFLEMLGIAIFIYTLLSYLKSQLINIKILFD